MTLDDLCKKVRDKIRDSEDILAACQELFGSAYAVFYSATGQKSPLAGDIPIFLVIPEAKHKAQNGKNKEFDLYVGLELVDETVTDSTDEDTGVQSVEYRGAQSLETLLDLAWEEIRTIKALTWTQLDCEIESIEFFPRFVGMMTLTAAVPNLIGGAEPVL